MDLLREYLVPWSISNTAAILVLITALERPKFARLLFVILFAWASWINTITAQHSPESYIEYAAFTPFAFYKNFINGWFAAHVTTMVTLIAAGQGLIAIGFALKGWFVRLAGIGAIIFFLAIAPLGIGSGFPCTLIGAITVYILLKKDPLNYLWKRDLKKTEA